ncbi:T9SS type A sorting domain-containing protein [bacterium]|nr:T9SS type A sorting domain-containing protein [bacterium]
MHYSFLSILFAFLLLGNIQAQNAIHFDGNDDYVNLTTFKGVTGTNARSIEAWIQVPPGAENLGIVCWGSNIASQKWTFRIQNTNGSVNGNIRIECNGGYITGSTDLRDSAWHHVAVVWENDGTPNIIDALLYVDGVLETTNAQQSYNVNTASGSDVRIGRRHVATGSFEGGIDEVRIWNTARTQTEIQANMNKEICKDSALVAYHSFNQGTAFGSNTNDTVSTDKSSTDKDGELRNFVLAGDTSNWVTGVQLTAANPPLIQLSGDFHNQCFGDTTAAVSSSVSGGATPYDYLWSTGSTNTSISSLGAGTYTLRVTDDSLCASDTSFTITQGAEITTSYTTNGVFCAGDQTGSISLTASGGTGSFSFAWSNGSTMQSPTGLEAGTYTVTITDSVGCEAETNATIIQFFDPLEVSLKTAFNLNCPGDSSGYIFVEVDGGLSPYSYLWDDAMAQTVNPINFLPEGSYTVTVTDSNDCEDTLTIPLVTLGDFPEVDLGSNINTDESQVTLDAPAGYTSYLWSNNASSPSITVTTNGTYSVTVGDEFGCKGEDEIKVKFFPVGIQQINNESNWKVYPNPTSDFITIVEAEITGSATYTLRDISGRIILKNKELTSPTSTIELPEKNGIYLLELNSDSSVEHIQVVKE